MSLDLRAILSSLFKDPSSPEVYFGQVLNKQASKHLIHSQGSENQESPVVTQGKNAGALDRVTGGWEGRWIYMMRRRAPQLLLTFGCRCEKSNGVNLVAR